MNNFTIQRELTPETRKLGKEFINKYHSYIKWADRPSRKLYWNLYENDIMVGVFALGSAFSKPKTISSFMISNGIEFNEMANNIVFCMANQVDKNAGTKLLSLVRKDAIEWWYERYNNILKSFQTFILPPRNGAVYKADNWIELGMTSGNTQTVKTISKKEYESDMEKYDKQNIEIRTFKNGQTRYIIREFAEIEKKIIFVKLNSRKELYEVNRLYNYGNTA